MRWAAALVFVAILYFDTLVDLVTVWNTDPNYSHGFIVPVACCVFAWMAGRRVGPPSAPRVNGWATLLGLGAVALGILGHIAAWFCGVLFFDVVALIVILCGLLLNFGGGGALMAYGFSAVFLIFMAPWPQAWYQPIAIQMQLLVGIVSTWGLDLIGVPAYREGNLVFLPGYTMEIGAACSGLRQLTAVLALSAAIGHLGGRRWWYLPALAILAAPIAVLSNCARVLITGIILKFAGKPWAEGVFHTLEGLAIVGMAALVVVGVAWLLARIQVRLDLHDGSEADRAVGSPSRDRGPESKSFDRAPTLLERMSVRTLLAVLVLSCGLLADRSLVRYVAPAKVLPPGQLRLPLAALPLAIGPWHGQDRPVDDEQLLYADQQVRRQYVMKGRRQAVLLWMAFSTEGTDRGHHPEVCMAVAGQPEDRQARHTFPLAGHAAPVQQYRFGAAGNRQTVFYWHYTFPPAGIESLDQVQRIYQRMQRRPASVTIEVFAPESRPEDVLGAQQFVRLLDAEVQAIVGPAAVRGSERLPVTVIQGAAEP